MRMRSRKSIVQGVLLALIFILGMSGVSQGAEFWLRAEVMTKTMPDSTLVTMWGFGQCTDGTYTTCSAATVPGPRLTVPPSDTTLTINLMNGLTGSYVEPVSIVIPGQTVVANPVRNPDGRVRSFTAEAIPGGTATYTWNNLKPGTYLYQSGTHPAVQVQMGLYGAMTRDTAANQAYGASTAYAAETILLFSEIDPALHTAVELATYGTASYPSTFAYEPKYFLINGAPASGTPVPLSAGIAGGTTLLRYLNAGLKHRAPTFLGLDMSLVAEDGNAYAHDKQQYSFLLSPGKTIDALITPATYGSYPVFDRRLGLTNAAAGPGGMLAQLSVAPAAAAKIGVFQAGTWYLDASGNGAWDGNPPDSVITFGIGLPGVQPATGDWTGSGTAKAGAFTDGTWYLDLNGNGAWDGTPTDGLYVFGAGIPGAVAVAGDWTGSGSAKIGVYKDGAWWIDVNGNGAWDAGSDRSFVFDAGVAGAVPVTGDWNGTSVTKAGLFKDGTWYVDLNGNGTWDGTPSDATYSFGVGLAGALPVAGDWTGTGRSQLGVFADGNWYLDMNGNNAWDGTPTDAIYVFGVGLSGASPLSGNW